jgi:hypothetical protein
LKIDPAQPYQATRSNPVTNQSDVSAIVVFAVSEEDRERFASATSQRLQRGFRDDTWFLQTRGTNCELVLPERCRAAVVRTISAEADGRPLPEPDSSSAGRSEFSWLTEQEYVPNKDVAYSFKDWRNPRTKDI